MQSLKLNHSKDLLLSKLKLLSVLALLIKPDQMEFMVPHLVKKNVHLHLKEYGLDPEKRFNVPEDVYEIFKSTMLKRANENEDAWNNKLKNYSEAYPELAEEFKLAMSGKLPNNYADALPEYDLNHSGASRADSGEIIQN